MSENLTDRLEAYLYHAGVKLHLALLTQSDAFYRSRVFRLR
jgi:hypothetical protein